MIFQTLHCGAYRKCYEVLYGNLIKIFKFSSDLRKSILIKLQVCKLTRKELDQGCFLENFCKVFQTMQRFLKLYEAPQRKLKNIFLLIFMILELNQLHQCISSEAHSEPKSRSSRLEVFCKKGVLGDSGTGVFL